MNNVFAPNLMPTQWYDNNSIPSDGVGYIQYQNKILGQARLSQFRVNIILTLYSHAN